MDDSNRRQVSIKRGDGICNAWENRVLGGPHRHVNIPMVLVRYKIRSRVRGEDPAGTGPIGVEKCRPWGVLNHFAVLQARGPPTHHSIAVVCEAQGLKSQVCWSEEDLQLS